jgi:succinate--hydroxymethylglutarate CoA-transferase
LAALVPVIVRSHTNLRANFAGGESSYFLGVNRSKKSLAIDFKRPEGRRALEQLAAQSDVLIQNFLPGALEKHGLGYDDLRRLNPRLIYVTLTGYGPAGPDAHRPGYDVIVSARGGLMGITGNEGGPPCKVGVAVTDLCTGLQAFAGILGALWARERGGPSAPGQRVDCSLLETQVSMLANIGSAYLTAGVEGRRYGTAHPSIVPCV